MPTPLSALRRWHKWWFWPIEIGALLILAAWWWYANHSPMGRLRASGAPMTFEELVPEPIPDEENIAAGLRDLQPRIAKVPVGLYEFGADFGDLADPTERLQEAREWLEPQADLVTSLLEVAERPRYASLMSVTDMQDPQGILDYPQRIRPVARLLTLETRAALAEGEIERAVRSTEAMLRFAKAWDAEPFLTGRLIACAVQSMALLDADLLADRDDLTAEQARSLRELVERIEDRSAVDQTLVSERVMTLERLKDMPVAALLEQGSMLRFYEQALREVREHSDDLAAGKVGYTPTRPLASQLLPATQSLFEAETRVAGEAQAVREKLSQRLGE